MNAVLLDQPRNSGRTWAERKRAGRLAQWTAQGGRCCFCQQPTRLPERRPGRQAPDTATLEHVVPRGSGGSQGLRNCRISCWQCNNDRGDMDFEAFKALKTGVPT